jgi:hypothetical protein
VKPLLNHPRQRQTYTFEGAPERARAALSGLLAGRRMRVGPDPERGFRVEGVFHWPLDLEARAARAPQATGRLVSVVAGEGYARV